MPRLLWQQRQDIGPPARFGAAMVYMTSREKSLLWGGFDGSEVLGDTWEWDGEGWIQVDDTGPAPSVQGAVGLAFDSVRKVAVFFGLGDPAPETWEWDGEAWTQVEDTGPQPFFSRFQMVYDRSRQVTILEGGSVQSGSNQFLPVGTWAWDGRTWTQVADVGPPQRFWAALGYDGSRERTVHFGGANIDKTFERDTWEWDGNTWEQVTNMGPTARVAHAMTGTSGATLLFGGLAPPAQAPFELLRDTWTWDGTYWHQRQDMGPSPRFWHAISWDPARRRGVLFGGLTVVAEKVVFLSDTWESFEAT
jgi:hypothetical protein